MNNRQTEASEALLDVDTFLTEVGFNPHESRNLTITFTQGTPSLPMVEVEAFKIISHDQLVEALERARDAYKRKKATP